MDNKIGIIGGGAAGMMGAIQAARAGGTVTIFEKNERLGKKILMTGNGKCNLSNKLLSMENYFSSDWNLLESFFSKFGTEDSILFFRESGLLLKNKAGLIYPLSEQATSVLDVLRFEIKRLNVLVITEEEIMSIHKKEDFLLQGKKKKYHVDKVLIATGGKSCQKTGSDGMGFRFAKQLGHGLVPQVPALVQLRCKGDFWKAIAGVRCDATLKLMVGAKDIVIERGELQLTDYGISGIPVFQFSRSAAYGIKNGEYVRVIIDFLPDYLFEELLALALTRYQKNYKETAEEFFTGYLNKKIMLLLMKQSEIRATSMIKNIPFKQLQKVFENMKSFEVVVTDTNSFQNAQVCAGGVPLKEITNNMESIIVKGLYFAGEVLDVDGRCGGYNLQWAWTSGYLAGQHIAKE